MTFKILLALDGTPVSLEQTRFAIRLTLHGLKAEFVVTNVQEPASFYEVLRVRDPEALREIAEGSAQDSIAPCVKLLEGAGIPHQVILAQDTDTVQGLLELMQLEQCGMVIVGEHDHSLLAGKGLRSTGERLARIAPVPVVSVRAPAGSASEVV